MSGSGSSAPIEIRFRISSQDDLTRFELNEVDGRLLAARDLPRSLVLEVRSQWQRIRARWSGEPAFFGEFGEILSTAVPEIIEATLQEAVGRGLESLRPLRLIVECEDPALAELPWEWLVLKRRSVVDAIDGPLALAANVRIVRTTAQPVSVPEDALRVLIVVADPASAAFPQLPWLANEAKAIASAFGSSRRRGIELQTMFDAMPASLEETLAEFRPHIVHFAGHGQARPGGGVLVLRGPRANSERLLKTDLLATWLVGAGTQLVFLSACDTAGSGGSAAQTLVDRGIPTVVAMQTPVSDAAQPHFARIFYGSLLSGSGVDEAVAEARQASAGAANAWAPPILYCSDSPYSVIAAHGPALPRMGPNNLPRLESPTFGRDEEIDKIARMCRESRLVVLTGPGGIGKTRLSIEAAAAAHEVFPDGIWHVECESCVTAESVLFAVARTLDLNDCESATLESVCKQLSDKRTLLVLDCFEGVVAAGQHDVVERLLQESLTSLLITSRFRLGAKQERTVEISPLGQDQTHGLELMLQSQALKGRKLGDHEARSLRNICEMLEGVPLALVIAAGRLRFVQPAQLESLLRERPLSTLGGSNSGVSVAIRRSLSLVPEEDLRFLRDLSVFAGAFDWSEVSEVYPEDSLELLEHLSLLVDRSLIQPEGAAEQQRFRILDSLREYVDSLEASESELERLRLGREKHLQLFGRVAKSITEWMGQGRWAEGTKTLWSALPNLRTALDYAMESGHYDEAEALCRSLAHVLMETGWRDFEHIAAVGYELAEQAERPRVASLILSLEGAIKSRGGDYKAAEDLWARRLALCRSIQNHLGATDTLLDMAGEAVSQHRASDAKKWIDEAAVEIEKIDRPDLRAVFATVRARYFDLKNDPISCANYIEEAETWLREAPYSNQSLFVQFGLAGIWKRQGHYSALRRAMERCLREAVAGERRNHAAISFLGLAEALVGDQHLESASKCFVAAISLFRELGSHRLRESEDLFTQFKKTHSYVSSHDISRQSWDILLPSILAHLSALNLEEDQNPS